MLTTKEHYQQAVSAYWDKYIGGKEPLPERLPVIRPEVLSSWRRSLACGVSPFEAHPSTLSAAELNERLHKNEELILVSRPYLQDLYNFVRGTNFTLTLVDRDGYVIDQLMEDSLIIQRAHDSGLQLGASRSECVAGTGGIALAFATKKPYQLVGCEHFIKPHHIYVCSAAPIWDSEHRQMLGALTMAGPVEQAMPHSLGMVCAAVSGIQKELALRRANLELSRANLRLQTTVEAFSSGVLLLNRDGVVQQYNKRALEFLKSPNVNPTGLHLWECLVTKPPFSKADLTKRISNMEVSATGPSGVQVNLVLSFIPNADQTGSVLVTIETDKYIRKLVSKMGGFTAKYDFSHIIGNSSELESAKSLAKMAATGEFNVLILGESGTGKELFAQSIHNASARANGPFVAINCASIPKNLIESELFGYENGAFTGASKGGYPGKFELADGGTFFLDEIGDMPFELQSALLRALQEKEITRIGGKQPKRVDVRIIAATNADLRQKIKEGVFRSDLYYRINVFSIEILPLRSRSSDVQILTDYFITRNNQKTGSKRINSVSGAARRALSEYNWPGNVRELENIVERAIITAPGDTIDLLQLPVFLRSAVPQEAVEHWIPKPDETAANGDAPGHRTPVEERAMILAALEQQHGDVGGVSRCLGISKRTLYRKLKKYNLDVNRYRVW